MPRPKTKINRRFDRPWGAFLFWRGLNARIRTVYQGLIVLESIAFTSEDVREQLARFDPSTELRVALRNSKGEVGEFLVLPRFEFQDRRHWA